jgi:arylsulfatase A-like enzyme
LALAVTWFDALSARAKIRLQSNPAGDDDQFLDSIGRIALPHRTIPGSATTLAAESAVSVAKPNGVRPLDIMLVSAWSGLAGGLLEVGMRVLCRSIDSTGRLYMISRHYVWLAPVTDLILFSGVGLPFALATRFWPRPAGWLSLRVIGLWALLPGLLVVSGRIYIWAWAILALGIASILARQVERRASGLRRWLLLSFPALVGATLIAAGSVFGIDRLKLWREAGRDMPPGGSPNVLLIVLDTVRADRLSLYGYGRATSPTLQRLAQRGVRFDGARATAPWTLPSHAGILWGRWPHEVGSDWETPLKGDFPTLAQYLGACGYSTAGFVANTRCCSYDTRLDRGFTHYEDYLLDSLSPFRALYLGNLAFVRLSELGWEPSRNFGLGLLLPGPESAIWRVLGSEPKIAASSINRRFLDWLSQRRQPNRPFFAFLNYFDAHTAYFLPPGGSYRFGLKPETESDFLVFNFWVFLDKLMLPPYYVAMARDCYDDCLAYVDEKLGELLAELDRRGILEQTLVVVASDHGEGLGEHGLFFHGESLYRTEIGVPLLIVPPSFKRALVVSEPVSLRDLPATVADLAGFGADSPFPGRSLARFWQGSSATAASSAGDEVFSELASPNPFDPNQGRSPSHRGPLVSLAEGNFVYIRNEGDGQEELFEEPIDPGEIDNRAYIPTLQPVLERFRARLNMLKTRSPLYR